MTGLYGEGVFAHTCRNFSGIKEGGTCMTLRDLGFYRGVDLGGWLSQCDYSRERMDSFITEKDMDVIADWGLDHVRIPVDYNILENQDGSYKKDGFERIERAIGWCRTRKMKAVLDLHKTFGFSFDSGEKEEGFFHNKEAQERFYRLWEELAAHFCSPEDVAFELLNEVTDPAFIQEWNRIAGNCIAGIRRTAPRTLILVGSYRNNSADAVPDLAPPADDRVIYNFHCYTPLEFTHQGAPWVPWLDLDARVSFREAGITEKMFENLFMPSIQAAEKNHTCLYCGEYGVIDRASPEDTVLWYRTIHSVLEKYQISRAAWTYKQMDFGLSDTRMDGVRKELIQYL